MVHKNLVGLHLGRPIMARKNLVGLYLGRPKSCGPLAGPAHYGPQNLVGLLLVAHYGPQNLVGL